VKHEIVAVGPVTPLQRVERNEQAVAAVAAVVKKNYIKRIGDRGYLMVAGAQAVGSSLGFTTAVESLRYVPPTEHLAGYWESVAIVYDEGVVVGRGVGSVFDDERTWSRREHFARQMMAQTRATGRALKGVMGWATALLGAEASLAEEMPAEGPTMPGEAFERAPAAPRLPSPAPAPERTEAAMTGKAPKRGAGPVIEGEIVSIDAKEGKSGRSYWRICVAHAGRREWFTSFEAVEGLEGKRARVQLRDDGKGGLLVEDIAQADSDPDPIPF